MAGALNPGDRLDEQRLATGFGASRTPVREALRHLSASGLVELRPRKGAVVAEISIPRMIHMFEVMAELEAMCARLAARRMTAPERERLKEIHAEHRREVEAERPDPDHCFVLCTRFHDMVYAGSHNPFLEETARNIRNRILAYRRRQLHQPGRVRDSYDEHGRVLQAILDGDGARAADLIRRHVSMQGDVFTDFLCALTTSDVVADAWR